MKIKNWKSINDLLTAATSTLLRFPGVLIFALGSAAVMISELQEQQHFLQSHLVWSLLLGIPLFLASTFYRESRGWTSAKFQGLELGLGSAVIALHFLLTKSDQTTSYPIHYLQLSVALHLLVSFSAFTKDKREIGFWQFNQALFQRILFSAFYTSVLYSGLMIALVICEFLFKLGFEYKTYLTLWILLTFVFQTWHFLAGLPKNISILPTVRTYPNGLKVFVQYVLIPLVTLYMVILYFYMGKIAIDREWPAGYLGWLIAIMSVLGILNLLLIEPEKENSESLWIRNYAKAYYVLILPLLALLLGAVGRRISEYGVTESRYALLVLGLLLTGLSLYFIFSREKKIKVVPISLFAVAIFSLVGPWGISAVSMRSQKNRLREIMDRNQLIENDQPQPAKKSVAEDDQVQIRSKLNYLFNRHGNGALGDWLPAADRSVEPSQNIRTLMTRFHLPVDNTQGTHVPVLLELKQEEEPLDIQNFRHVFVVNNLTGFEKVRAKDFEILITLENFPARLAFKRGKKVVGQILLQDLVTKNSTPANDYSRKIYSSQMLLKSQTAELDVSVLFMTISATVQNATVTVNHVTAMIFFK